MEAQVFGAFLTWGALGLLTLGAAYAAWKIIGAQHLMIKEIGTRSATAIENNTVAMNTLGERMTDVEGAVRGLDGRLVEVEKTLEENN